MGLPYKDTVETKLMTCMSRVDLMRSQSLSDQFILGGLVFDNSLMCVTSTQSVNYHQVCPEI